MDAAPINAAPVKNVSIAIPICSHEKVTFSQIMPPDATAKPKIATARLQGESGLKYSSNFSNAPPELERSDRVCAPSFEA